MTRAGFICIAGPILAVAIQSAAVSARNSTHQDPQAPPPVTGSAQSGSVPRAKVTSPHGPLSITCQNCHTNSSWKPIRAIPEFNHDNTRYPLRGMHAKVACTQCHTSMVFTRVSTQCSECHADIHRGQFGANCESCHSVKGWQVSVKDIQNHQNRFPLVGAHALVECDQCHKNAAAGQFAGLSTACYSCHQKDFRTPVLNHVALNFPTACETCHSMNNFVSAKFDHLKFTGYALTGAHATLECTACHINNVFAGTSAQCYSCHTADFTNSHNPPHVQLGLPRDCGTCHNTTDWNNALFDHALYAHYPLTGKHATVPCSQCHSDNNYTSTPTDCYACHKSDFTGTTSPNHVTAAFPTNCAVCHTTAGWTPSTFNHNTTSFPLTGFHATMQCAQCHTTATSYNGSLPTTCYGCHQADFTGANNPPHVSGHFPTDCTQCHNTTSWTTSTFNHNNTSFPLTGAHVSVPCASCHTNNNYSGSLPTACYGCHQADFTGTTNPAHVAAGFPTDCTQCHNTTSWTTSTFNHNNTSFPLTGFHATMQCAQCHTTATSYNGSLPTACYGCHQADFTGTTNPAHVAGGFPTDCSQCHSTTNWLNATFNHNNTSFPLTGFHATMQCAQCHTTATSYNGSLPTACYGCHQADFTGTTNPPHVSTGFPTDCTICHSTTNWTTSTFNHSTTSFPLTGFHATMACAQCHTSATTYNGSLPTLCSGCHMADYNGTTNPAHASAGFPTTCDTCHTTTNWLNATFNHNNTPFPLTGFHVNVACTLCHVNNVFAGTPTLCSGCHMADYNGTTNPAHASAGWPTTCDTCHTTTAWLPATLPTAYHTLFPVNHGNANGVCTTCHANSADYSVFSCTASCHGSGNAANFNHPNVNGYVYNSVNCYACHKNGSGG
jgi:hypothetical protein